MHRRTIGWALVCLWASHMGQAQEFRVWDHAVQVHGFASQGFVYTGANNWLTMTTTTGSAAFTDFRVNASTTFGDKFRVGAQLYDRDIAQIGKWHPELDWAFADYKIHGWLGVRGGKVKSTMGLHNDTQDLDFLHPWAILPQSIYPLDLRGGTMSHVGGDSLRGHAYCEETRPVVLHRVRGPAPGRSLRRICLRSGVGGA